jgi:FkbM family methyltransferase
MNILVHGTILGYGGIAHHTREFTKALSKYHNVKIRNFNLVDLDDWAGYTGPNILKNARHLDEIHHKLLYQQTLYDNNGELAEFPLSGYEESFVPDVHIIMAEVNHYYHYQDYDKPVIVYFPWETTNVLPKFMERLHSADYIWVPSEWQKQMLIDNGLTPNKISVVHEGIDSKKYYPIKKKNDKLTFLHIGTWGYRKSSYEIIKTFLDIFGNNNDVELRISINNKLDYQEGPIETFERFGLSLNRNIKILGTLSEDEYVKELQNADLYISCSRGEGWNLPVIQAMSCGVPSIYSKCGGQLEFSKNNLGIGIDIICENLAKRSLTINKNSYSWESLQDYLPNNLFEPDYPQLSHELKLFYSSYLNNKNLDYIKKSLEDSKFIHQNFNWDYITENANKILESYINQKVSNIYYLIHSQSFGDTLASTPTLRYLSKSYGKKINVVTNNKKVFNNNPCVDSVLTFDEYNGLILSDIIKHESFTFAGRKDNNGTEKKFSHIDARQIHAMDLGFQLPNEDLEYDFYPDPLSLDIELPERYVALHVTTNWANRTWDYNNWVELIKWLKENNIFTVLVGAGYKEELHKSYSSGSLEKDCPMFDDYYGLDLTNKGNMSDMFWVIDGAECLVTMDSGPLHLASCTDTHIIQLGSAINPAFKRFYRRGDWKYKYHFLGGSCGLFCNTNLSYNVKVWGDINSVPPLPNCLENKPTFECHPAVGDVINKLTEILEFQEENKYLDFFELLPNNDEDRINFNFRKTTDDIVSIVIKDVRTGLIRDKFTSECSHLDGGNYWWAPMPGKVKNLGDIDLYFYLNDVPQGKKRLYYQGGMDLIINGEKYTLDYLDGYDYPTFWEIFINGDYEKEPSCVVEKGDIVLDIGANKGFFTLNALQKGASKVYSVEPVKHSYEQIKKLLGDFPNVKPINKAIGESNGTISMFVDSDLSATNCVTTYGNMFDRGSNKVDVESININTLIEQIDSKINYMKVDCEGSEFELFKTITEKNLKNIDKLVIETHGEEIDTFVHKTLIDNNFRVHRKGNILFAFASSIIE